MNEDWREARTPEMTRCPECESDLELDGYELDVGETLHCPECSTELRVVANDPVAVTLAET
jgi:lysine biosynthesis protein LysW